MPTGDPLMWIFTFVVACASALSLIAIRSSASLARRIGSIGLMTGLVGGSYAGLAELMSRPKPASLEWVRVNAKGAKVAGSQLRENEAIYLWLVFDGETEPRAYKMPWSMEMARQLREAMGEASRRQAGVRMNKPFHRERGENERAFHAPPRAALPPKSSGAS
jgi:hypothetical protein